MSWMDRLERRFASWSIPGTASFFVGMNAAVGVLSMMKPEFPDRLALYPAEILGGEVWRPLTFLFIPPSLDPLSFIFWLILLFTTANALENQWGDFKFNLFWAIGIAATTSASLILGAPASNLTLGTSLFLAFAKLFPNLELLIFFVLPVKVKWLGALAWIVVGWNWLWGGLAVKTLIMAGLANYFVFFGAAEWRDLKIFFHHWKHRNR